MPQARSALLTVALLLTASLLVGATAPAAPLGTAGPAGAPANGTGTDTAAARAAQLLAAPPVLVPLDEHPRTARNVVDQLQTHHFIKRPLDDAASAHTLDAYLKLLDEDRAYFTASDIQSFERYRTHLDEALRSGDLAPAYDIFNRYQLRVTQRLQHLLRVIGAGIDKVDLAANDSLELDRAEAPWPKDEAALDQLWLRRLKATIIPMQLHGKSAAEIQELLLKRYRNRLQQTLKTATEDAFGAYINAFASTYDPHTQYFSPRVSENFNITMSLQLEGIGAVLRSDDDYVTVVSLVPAGPADKSGELKPQDRIVGVGQGASGPITDVVGWRLDDVVEMIRGPKATVVRLEVMPAGSDGGTKILQITRNTVQLEEQSAQKKLITIEENGRSHRIGVISIPTFYADFEAMQRGVPDYKSTTRDVARLINELKAEGAEGLVIDLRNNGGGSLVEANSLTGLFIDSGPTVQLRGANRRVTIYSDDDGQAAWNGPLAVLVNRMSASASEIFAAAIQDYQRGLIIGSTTFGKGTVQSLEDLSRGQLKYTQQKFYRISGQSTQHRGVAPDVAFPDVLDPTLIGESALDDAMAWDTIPPAAHRRLGNLAPLLPQLTANHRTRVANDPEFNYVRQIVSRGLAERERKRLSLNIATRRTEQAEEDAWRLKLENDLRRARGEPLLASINDLEEDEDGNPTVAAGGPPPLGSSGTGDGTAPHGPTGEPAATDAAKDEKKEKPDAMLRESGYILLDFIAATRKPAATPRTAQR
jgi:carboxyl-terminal processing protease